MNQTVTVPVIELLTVLNTCLEARSVDVIESFIISMFKNIPEPTMSSIENLAKKDFPRVSYVFGRKEFKLERIIYKLSIENDTMKRKIDELETEVKYMPGGQGYQEAKKSFEQKTGSSKLPK